MPKTLDLKPRTRGPKIGKLTSVAMCGVEIGRLYRQMRRGDLDTIEGVRMTQVLLGMKACLEYSDIEKRMAELEAALQATSSDTVQPLKRAA